MNSTDPITVGEIVDTLKSTLAKDRSETSLYRIYRKLAMEHGKCWSLDISDRLFYPKAAINVKAVIVGDPGSGKSVAGAATCEGVSFWNSLREWDDTRHMLYYFDVDPAHVAIMLKNDIRKMFQNANIEYNCYLGDDIGSAWNSRLWAKLFNQILNAYIGTDRTFRTFKLITLASDKEMDAQARNKFTDYVEMDGPQVFEHNMTFGKLFRIRGKARINKIFYPRLRGMDMTTGQKLIYQKIGFIPPSTPLKVRYDGLRDDKAREFHTKSFKELDEMEEIIMAGGNPKNPNAKNKMIKDQDKEKALKFMADRPYVKRPKYFKKNYFQELADETGYNAKSLEQWYNSGEHKKYIKSENQQKMEEEE